MTHVPSSHRGGAPSLARRAARRLARRGTTTTLVVTAALLVGTTGIALASGIVGSPQPELAQFAISAHTDGAGGGAVLADGVTVYAWPASDTSMSVCTLHPGGRACASHATLANDGGSDLYGPPVVLTTGGNDVSVIVTDETDVISYNSTDGGVTFAGHVVVGSLYASQVGVAVGGTMVIAGIDPHQGLVVQSVNPAGPINNSEAVFDPGSGCNYDPSISTADGGVLVACDDLTNTYVYFAPQSSNFSSTGSYSLVAEFHGQEAVDLSGTALLTVPSNSITTGGDLAFFTGSAFAPGHKVPDSKAGDDSYWAMQEVGGVAHVFFEGRRDSYDLIDENSADGVHWSPQTFYGTAIDSGDLVPLLNPQGSGQVFESDGSPQLSQPILLNQSVHVAFPAPRVKVGVHDILRGSVGPVLIGQAVTLQRLISGKWYPVSTIHETSAVFSFTVAGATATYRAVVNERLGYYLYGYSNAATVTAIK